MDKIKVRKGRVKIVYLPWEFIVRFIQGFDGGEYLRLPTFEGLPDDIEVLNIMAFPARDAFGFAVYHPSFEETIPGNEYPEIVLTKMTFKKVKVERIGGD